MLESVATAGAFLLPLSIVAPVGGLLIAFAAGERHVERIALAAMAVSFLITGAVVVAVLDADRTIEYFLGNWAPPLGLALRADGLSAAMMTMTAVVVCAVGLYACAGFVARPESSERRTPFGASS